MIYKRCEVNLHSDLELEIMFDMYINGYDPSNKDDIIAYWGERL